MVAHHTPDFFPTEGEIPDRVRLETPIEQREYLCNGRIETWSGPLQDVFSPISIRSDEDLRPTLLGRYPLMEEKESLQALDAARLAWNQGQGPWPTLTVEERIHHVQDFVVRMQQVRDEVVRLLMWEICKTLPDAEKEFDRTVDYIQDTIDALKEADRAGSRFIIEEGVIAQVRRAPLGVVLCMGPFNYPLNETFTTLIPALIMGNVVIFKPPKLGVLLHHPLLRAFRDAFPPGVVNTVYGEGQKVIQPLMESGRIDVLAFIGSSRVGDLLKQQHPKPHRLRSVLGLEAKNVGVVLPDADLELAIRECALGALSFNGQRCTALKLLFVHQDVIDRFLKGLTKAIDGLPAGMPWQDGVRLTPLPEPNKTDQLTELIDDAVTQGARIVNPGGGRTVGAFMHPAVVYPVRDGMRLYAEEQFGPVVPVVAFDAVEEPLTYVVESDYGQQLSIFGADPDVIARLIDPLVNQVCRVNINSQCQRGPDTLPFTGRKDSAEGTLSVSDALRVFAIRTLVAAKDAEANREIIREIVRERKSKFLSTDFIL